MPRFQDEWVNFPYLQRAKAGGLAYDICPVRSFQDAAMWYYKEMMTCFDVIYWDNISMAANFDTIRGQDRFTPELTVAETVGRQCGNTP